MRVLITNDDGVDSVGIQILAAAIAASGDHEVMVIAPADDRSGTGAALGSFWMGDGGIPAAAVTLPEAPGIEAWALEGTPAMCVLAAALGGFGEPPELIVSGINAGLNTGRAILHSGTVGAVLTGQNFGISGLAVSTALSDPWRWDTAAAMAVQVLPMLIDAPPRSALNLNVPALALDDLLGIRWARLAAFGETRAVFKASPDDEPAADPNGTGAANGDGASGTATATGERRRLRMELELSTDGSITPTSDAPASELEVDTDQGLARAGWATLTTLVGVVEAWPGDHLGDAADAPVALTRTIVPGATLDPAHRVPDGSSAGALRRPVLG